MRADMYQVIIERPRGGAGWGRDWPRFDWRSVAAQVLPAADDAFAAEDPEAAVQLQPRRFRAFADGGPHNLRMGPAKRSKWLSENLAPLRRFLVRRLGRRWNDVHAEICAHIKLRSAVQKHVLDHLRHFVELHPVMIDGWPHYPMASGAGKGAGYRPLSDYGGSFYVCPETGTLQLARRSPASAVAPVAAAH